MILKIFWPTMKWVARFKLSPHLLFFYVFLDLRLGLKVCNCDSNFLLRRLEATVDDMCHVVLFTCVNNSFTLKSEGLWGSSHVDDSLASYSNLMFDSSFFKIYPNFLNEVGLFVQFEDHIRIPQYQRSENDLYFNCFQ